MRDMMLDKYCQLRSKIIKTKKVVKLLQINVIEKKSD